MSADATRCSSSTSGPVLAGLSIKNRRISRVRADFDALLDRMRKRLYPETMQTLGSYWLKTVCARGYGRAEWKALCRFLEQAVRHEQTNPGWHDTLLALQASILGGGFLTGEALPPPKPVQATRPMPGADALGPYFVRLLNEWAPKELARFLLYAAEGTTLNGPGNRALAFARALERLLLREHLPPRTFEAAFQPNLFSPQFVCPAEYEILRDVLLFLLGRTDAPAYPVLPAALLGAAPDAGFHPDYAQAVRDALLINKGEGEELHVPISPIQAAQILEADQFRITSLVVTMDGRWWEADKLLSGDQNEIVYRPMGQLRIDYQRDEARLQIPWTETRLRWSGPVSFPGTLELFGRRWQAAEWEQAAEHAWLNLACAGALPLDAMGLSAETDLRRCKPAWVEMGWTAMEDALANSLTQKNGEPIEKLRYNELIPAGRALNTLVESLVHRHLRTPQAVEARLKAVSYQASALRASHGLIPWRVLPVPAQNALLGRQLYPILSDRLREVFEGVPETSAGPSRFLTRLWHTRRAA